MRGKTLASVLLALFAPLLLLPALPQALAAPLQAATSLQVATLPDLQLAAVQNAALPGSISTDNGFNLGGVGSALWRHPADPLNEFWMVTDRGPNGQICPPPAAQGCTRVRTFPAPEFTPLILRVRVNENTVTILQTIPILDSSGTPVTGLSNLNGKDELPYNIDATATLPFNPNGLDTEGLVRTSAGAFWLADEYRPSIVHVGANGRVIRRYIPADITLNATYPVSATLPAIFDRRTANRGFEAMALSYDERTVFAALQSPLSNPTRNVAGSSLNTRILALDTLTGQVTGEWVYRFEPQASFDPTAPVNQTRPNDEMKISGLIAVDNNTLLVLERTDFVAKVYKVTLNEASNILGSQWDDVATSPTLEQTTDLAAAGITPLPKTLIVDLDTVGAPDKIEGMALVGSNTLAIANDNDFNITSAGLPDSSPTRQRSQIITLRTDQLTSVLPNRVAAGDVTSSSAVLWARATAPGTLTFQYSLNENFSNPVSVTATITDTLLPARVSVSGLSAGTRYYYRATDSAGASSSGRFSTAAAPGAPRALRFGVSGDWRGELAPYPAIANAPGRNLDFFVLHGDTIYADYASPALPLAQASTIEQFRVKHNEVYGDRFGINAFGDLRASTATFATIDDHEVTNDFAGGAPLSADPRFVGQSGNFINETALYRTGIQAFQEYNPLREEFYGATGDPRTAGKRRLYRHQTFGSDAAIFVLDNRSFRDPQLPGVSNLNDPVQVAAFLARSFDPNRTMLGRAQLDDLFRDLIAAERAGVTWKFVLVPEPIQNLGLVGASDRFEGYAAERTAILSFIKLNNIRNVVFVAADIHGTVVNNLTYQIAAGEPQISTGAFEITTGAVAFEAPFGPTVIELGVAAGLVTPAQKAQYDALPRAGKDALIAGLIDQTLAPLGYNPVGLQNSGLPATLVQGGYVSLHTYGWTEFSIDQTTRQLRVTTYGIDWYSEAQLRADSNAIRNRQPAVVSEFTVDSQRYRVSFPLIGR